MSDGNPDVMDTLAGLADGSPSRSCGANGRTW